MSEKELGGIILSGIFFLALAIIIATKLFPIFLIGSIVVFAILVVVVIIEICNDSFGEISIYIGLVLLGFVVLTLLSWFVGFGIGGTSLGQASVNLYTSIVGVEKEVNKELQNTMKLVVAEYCAELNEQDCLVLTKMIDSADNIQTIHDSFTKLKQAELIVNSVT
ncbi:MAG: hypothetical protein AB7V77_01675 [Candidatus Woesearchaeota archaeon]